MIRTVIESPWRASEYYTVEQHSLYLDHAIADSINRGETPYASHKMLTASMDDQDPAQREAGINAGYAWGCLADRIAVYGDFGLSSGMKAAVDHYRRLGLPIEWRSLPHKLVDSIKKLKEPD